MSTPLSPLSRNPRVFSPRSNNHETVQKPLVVTDDYKENPIYSSPSKKKCNNANDNDAGADPQQEDCESREVRREFSTTPMKRSCEFQGLDGSSDERNKKSMSRKEESDINIYVDEDVNVRNKGGLQDDSGQDTGDSMIEEKQNEGMSTVFHGDSSDGNENTTDSNNAGDDDMADEFHDSMDDTCLSTFSAVINTDMTAFAKLRESPAKTMRNTPSSPARQGDSQHGGLQPTTPSTVRKTYRMGALFDASSPVGSPTPRRTREPANQNDNANLLEFTDQINFFPRQPYGQQSTRYSPSRRSPLRTPRESIRSPAKLSLLDFDIPPAPTPRSIPSVTPRELESLKSGFLSEISSLKATLSGKEAEVTSLKQSVADAERRVGEALEEVRNESARREALEIEQSEWVQRSKEMETVLRNIKSDMIEGERERERLARRVEEAEKCKEQLEGKIVELGSQLSAARKSESKSTPGDAGRTKTAEETANEVQDAVEKVARELHTLYKSKHETKVAALKKSYEARWEKRVREAENKLKAALAENESLKAERATAMSEAPDPNRSMIVHANDEREAEKRVLEAQIKGLQQEMAVIKEDNERLHTELKMERAEKGELVAAVDEWLAMQQNQPQTQQQQQQQRSSESPSPQEPKSSKPVTKTSGSEQPENFRQSVSRGGPSGIRPPSGSVLSGEKKIARYPGTPGSSQARTTSGGKSGIAVFTPGRSGIMGSIERMGRGGV